MRRMNVVSNETAIESIAYVGMNVMAYHFGKLVIELSLLRMPTQNSINVHH